MRAMKRVLAILLAVATVFTFTPFVDGNADSYAGEGTEPDQMWVLQAVSGLHNGYCVAGTTIALDTEQILKDDGKPSPIAETYNKVNPDQIEVVFYYQQASDGWNRLKVWDEDDYATLEAENIWVKVPDAADEGSDIKVQVRDRVTGWYYESYPILCRTRNVNSDFMENKGEITITLPDKDDDKDVGSIDTTALRNTMLISDYNDGISVTGDGIYDLNKDGKDDVLLVEDYAPDLELYFWGEADLIDMGKDTWTVTVKEGQPFGKLDGFDNVSGNAERAGYYSKITFKFPKRTVKKGKVYVKSASLVYTGKYVKPTINSVKVNGKTLKAGTDYTVSGSRKAIGQGKITITGKGKYKGTLTKTFTVKPGKVTLKTVTGGSKKFTAKWGKKGGDVKYQVKYRVKGTSTWKKAYTSDTSKTIKDLKKGKTYQVKVRAYKKVNGKTYYGKFSDIKTVKVK